MKTAINAKLVASLIDKQFPEYSHLPIKQVLPGGNDNYTFRLGKELLVRLPSRKDYAEQVAKEQKWLPIFAPKLSLTIPAPIAIGKPDQDYPFSWSIYKWLPGNSLDHIEVGENFLSQAATDLAKFLSELHQINAENAPPAGIHNFHRGGHLQIYDQEARTDIELLKELIDSNAALNIWKQALSSSWKNSPIWIHGDMAKGNILADNSNISAIIDFGCMAIGDPACDLTIAWTLFSGQSRKIFQSNLELDENTWQRAKGWALWKACYELVNTRDKTSNYAQEQFAVIESIILEN